MITTSQTNNDEAFKMPAARDSGQYGRPTYNQARKVIARFGGEQHLANLLGISRISVYRWQYRRPYGSDGLVPTAKIAAIKQVARLEGVLLRDADWLVEKNDWDNAEPVKPKKRATLADLLS